MPTRTRVIALEGRRTYPCRVDEGERDTPIERVWVALNPGAGGQQADAVRTTLDDAFGDLASFQVHTTAPDDDLSSLARHAAEDGADRLVACGGDGTVSALASGVAGTGVALAIVPCGTANLVARELGLPLELAAAVDLARHGTRTTAIDAMRFEDKAFISHISIGVYSRIAENVASGAKRRFGRLYYVWTLCRELWRGRRWPFVIEVDGAAHRYRASLVLAANIGQVGVGTLTWGSEIRPNDGSIDVCIVRGRSIRDYIALLWRAGRSPSAVTPEAIYLGARERVRISARGHLPVRADGEVVGHGSVDLEVVAGAVAVVTADEVAAERTEADA